jgi:hypothetical protein
VGRGEVEISKGDVVVGRGEAEVGTGDAEIGKRKVGGEMWRLARLKWRQAVTCGDSQERSEGGKGRCGDG